MLLITLRLAELHSEIIFLKVLANTNNKKTVARATCGIDIKANQSNDVHSVNAMNDDLQEQQQHADNGVPTCTTNQVFNEDFGS
jgi:hypothetical protein